MATPLIAAALGLGTRLLTGTRTEGIAPSPTPGPRVFYANHASHLDFALIWTTLSPALRASIHPVAAAEYWTRGPLRRYLSQHVFGGVLLDRTLAGRTPLAPLHDVLDRGESLLIFPEGTRGDGLVLRPFRPGILHLALERPGLELCPVWVVGSHRVLPKGALLPRPARCRVRFGKPLYSTSGEPREELLARLRDALLALRP